jgi:hypothetical protein
VQTPYLSIVATARNDDHGGNLLGRMQLFVSGWIEQARRFGIASELIIVEWNPPEERPRLKDVLKWPSDLGPCSVRVIEVPPELHRRYVHAEALPLYQMIAKNVGILRARGKFVLATNIDILFSTELAEFLSRQELDPDRMYRIDRHDAMSDVPLEAQLEEQLEYCRTHLIRINRREGSFTTAPDGSPALSPNDVVPAKSGILFGEAWFPVEDQGRGRFRWAGAGAEMLFSRTPRPGSVVVLDMEPGPATGSGPLHLEVATDITILDRCTVGSRGRLQIKLTEPASKLILNTLGHQIPLRTDPRVLCFRIFGVQLHEPAETNAIRLQHPTKFNRIGVAKKAAYAWLDLQYLLAKLAHGGPLVPLTVPVTPRLGKILKAYVDGRGFTGLLRHGLPISSANDNAAVEQTLMPQLDFLHTNGCGDFTLLAREKWLDLRGYPEFDVFSMNLDSVFCFAAHYGGVREQMLREPMRIYHIEHGTGSGWTPEGQAKLFERIAAKGLTIVDNDEVLAWATQMAGLKSPMIFNHSNWGLREFDLQETVLGG